MAKIFKMPPRKYSEKEMKDSEESATKELNEFLIGLNERYDVTVVPVVILGVNGVRGIAPIAQRVEVCSNKRLKK